MTAMAIYQPSLKAARIISYQYNELNEVIRENNQAT